MSNTPATVSQPRDLILQSCAALFAPGQVTELRVLGVDSRDGKTGAGWFNGWDKLADAALKYESRKPAGIYVTLNPLHTGCLARSANATKDWQKLTSSDRDVTRRHWLPIDLDPVRPSGVSSTDAELQAAIDKVREIVAALEGPEFSFPPGLRAHSGNGLHLLYRIDLPNDDAGKTLVSDCLKALDAKHSTEQVKIDVTNCNAARIWKLWGTIARKGESTTDRPHRRSCLWKTKGDFPTFEAIACVPAEALEQLAAFGRSLDSASPPAASATKKRTRKASKGDRKPAASPGEFYVDLDQFIADNGIQVTREESFDNTGKRYILATCLFDTSHTGTSACLGRSKTGRVFYKCQHDSCSAKGWQEVKALFKSQNKGQGTTATKTKKESSDEEEVWDLARVFVAEEWTDGDTGQVTARRHREVFYLYSHNRHCYREVSEDAVRVNVTRWLGDRDEQVTNRRVSDVINCVRAVVTTPHDLELPFYSKIDAESGCSTGDPQRHHWLTLKNGILDIDAVLDDRSFAECLMAHTPEWFSVTSLPFPFPVAEEQTKCPLWLRFLEEVLWLPGEDRTRIELLQEAFGYCFMQEAWLEAFFVFHGPGRNGKSTVMSVLRVLLGEENISSLSVEQLSGTHGTNYMHQLVGKLANLCADLNEMDRVGEGVLKAVVSGDMVTVRRLYKDPVQYRLYCKLFFATNVLPRFADTSLGIWRRMRLMPFDYVVPPEKVDVRLLNKLEQEMPGILYWALQGMVRLRKANRFTRSALCQTATRNFRLQCFPILLYLDECCENKGKCVAGDLWRSYKHWCDACGLKKPKPLHAFIRDVVNFWPHLQYTNTSPGMENHRELFGISIKPESGMLLAPEYG